MAAEHPKLHTVDITLSSEMPRAELLYRDLFFKHMY